MLSWAVVFLVVAIISGLFAFTGVAGPAACVAWTVSVTAALLAIVFAAMSETPFGRR